MVDDVSKFERVDVKPGKDYNLMVKETKEVNELLTELLSKQSITDSQRKTLQSNGPNLLDYTVSQKSTNQSLMVFQNIVPSSPKSDHQLINLLSSCCRSFNRSRRMSTLFEIHSTLFPCSTEKTIDSSWLASMLSPSSRTFPSMKQLILLRNRCLQIKRG